MRRRDLPTELPEDERPPSRSQLRRDALEVFELAETLASLSDAEVENLFRVIRELRSHGVGIVYISHRLDELPKVADRVTALRDGELVGTRPVADTSRAELIRTQVRLAKLPPGAPEAPTLVERQNELLSQFAAEWRAALGPWAEQCAFDRGMIEGVAGRAGTISPWVCRLVGLRNRLSMPGSVRCLTLALSSSGNWLTRRILRASPAFSASRTPP